MRTVKFLLAYSDRTWHTITEKVPVLETFYPHENEDMIAWAQKNMLTLPQYHDVVLIAVYNSDVSRSDYYDANGVQQTNP